MSQPIGPQVDHAAGPGEQNVARVLDRSVLKPRTIRLLTALERAWGKGEVDALDEVFAASYVRRGKKSRFSRDELKASILAMRRAYPDLAMTVTWAVEGESELALNWMTEGTIHDEFLGLPPTGRRFAVTGATFSRFQGDLVVEEEAFFDRRGGYSAAGVPLAGARPGTSSDADGTVSTDVLRSMHRKMVTGVTVVAVDSNGEPRGLAVNSFASVSLDPPLVLVCVQKSTSTYAHLIAARHFSVNVLAANQLDVVRVFASKRDRKFEQVAWHSGDYGTPLIDGAAAAMEVELQDTLHALTHTIFIGRVKRVVATEAAPLVYTNGSFYDGASLQDAPEPPA